MDNQHRPIDDLKYDVEIIKNKVINVENDLKIIKEIQQDTRLMLDKFISRSDKDIVANGINKMNYWFVNGIF